MKERLWRPMSKNCKNKIIVRDKLAERLLHADSFLSIHVCLEIFPINQFGRDEDFVGDLIIL